MICLNNAALMHYMAFHVRFAQAGWVKDYDCHRYGIRLECKCCILAVLYGLAKSTDQCHIMHFDNGT
jgi:hypothetical protein